MSRTLLPNWEHIIAIGPRSRNGPAGGWVSEAPTLQNNNNSRCLRGAYNEAPKDLAYAALAHSADSASACWRTVWTAASCRSGGYPYFRRARLINTHIPARAASRCIQLREDVIRLGRHGTTLTVLHDIQLPEEHEEGDHQALNESWKPRTMREIRVSLLQAT